MAVNYKIYQSKANNASKGLYYARAAYRESVGLVQRRPLPPPDKQKKESLRRMTLLTWCHQESNRGHKANL